ncbi:MAG: MBL fold metallo-hydrolase [Gracilibacteraceae bacterium]|jgi:phosphoribosyl 1,2-cyclic phosphate phosphodiesterase|nr:MBL fold metallo-hydrolase [Gracilibacteraceae bacterium]
MTVTFRIMGTGTGVGVPAFYCACPACREAERDPRLARLRPGAAARTPEETILFDAGPDLRTQLLAANIRDVDVIFLSHWHFDHFAGLGEMEYYVKLWRKEPVLLYLLPEAEADLWAAFPFLDDVFTVRQLSYGQEYVFGGGLRVTPLPAAHSIPTAGFLLRAEKSLAYFTDTAGLPPVTKEYVRGVDTLVCDATFHGENWFPHSHMNTEEAAALAREVGAGRVLLTHLAMHYSDPVTTAALTEELRALGGAVGLAFDGMDIEL